MFCEHINPANKACVSISPPRLHRFDVFPPQAPSLSVYPSTHLLLVVKKPWMCHACTHITSHCHHSYGCTSINHLRIKFFAHTYEHREGEKKGWGEKKNFIISMSRRVARDMSTERKREMYTGCSLYMEVR